MARGAGSSFPFRGTDSSLFHEKIVQLQLTDRRVYCESRSAISKAMENLEEKVEIVARVANTVVGICQTWEAGQSNH